MEIQYGGKLEFGDFISLADGNRLSFGWYAGTGIGGTLQYYSMWAPWSAYDKYTEWLKLSDSDKRTHWLTKKLSKGFNSKCIYKCYINSVHRTRVMKVTHPEDVFTLPEDLKSYQESAEVLKSIGMIKNEKS
jgi:hypothetical protein